MEVVLVVMAVVGWGKRSVYRLEDREAIWWRGLGVGEGDGEVVDMRQRKGEEVGGLGRAIT